MALRQKTDALAIGLEYAGRLRGDEGVTELAVRDIPGRIEIYLVTVDLDGDGERRLFSIEADLIRAFPSADVQLAVLNPRFFEGDLHQYIPSDALSIPLPT